MKASIDSFPIAGLMLSNFCCFPEIIDGCLTVGTAARKMPPKRNMMQGAPAVSRTLPSDSTPTDPSGLRRTLTVHNFCHAMPKLNHPPFTITHFGYFCTWRTSRKASGVHRMILLAFCMGWSQQETRDNTPAISNHVRTSSFPKHTGHLEDAIFQTFRIVKLVNRAAHILE